MKQSMLKLMWDEFSTLPKDEVPEKGDNIGNYIYRKFADIYLKHEFMSDLEVIAWSPVNPNPVTNRKFLIFQGRFSNRVSEWENCKTRNEKGSV